MSGNNQWSYLTFSELEKWDVRKAYEYRLQTLGEPIPEHLLTAEELAAKGTEKASEVDVDALKAALIEKGVQVSPRAGEKRILELAKENNLV